MKPGRFPIPLALALLTSAALSPFATAEEAVEMEMTFSEDFSQGTFKKTQVWSGEEANTFRSNLDKLFGNADGALDQAEVQKILEAAKNDTAANAEDTFFVDDNNANVTKDDVSITAQGLAGPANAPHPVMVEHELNLKFDPQPGASHKFNTTLLVGGNITVRAPDGFVVNETEGLVSPEFEDGKTAVTGQIAPGTDLVVHFAEGEPELNLPGGGNIPGFTLPAALAALGTLAWVQARSRRRP